MSFHRHARCLFLVASALAVLGGCPTQVPVPETGNITVSRIITQDPPNAKTDVSLPLAAPLTDGLGFKWDLEDDGVVVDGGSTDFPDAFDKVMILETFVEGTQEREYDPGTEEAQFEDGREIVIGPTVWDGGLVITRKIFVSPTQGFTRWLDIFENPTNTDISVESENRGNLGSDDINDSVFASSDGNTTVGEDDDWWINGQQFATDPTVAVFYAGQEDSEKEEDSVVFDYGEAQIVKAHSRNILATFWFQRSPNSGDPTSLLTQEAAVESNLETLMKSLESFPAVDPVFLEGMTAAEVNDLRDRGGNVVAEGEANSVAANTTVTVTNTANGSARSGQSDASGAFGPLNVVGAAGDTIEIVAGGQTVTQIVP